MMEHKFIEYIHDHNEPFNTNKKSISESGAKRIIIELTWNGIASDIIIPIFALFSLLSLWWCFILSTFKTKI